MRRRVLTALMAGIGAIGLTACETYYGDEGYGRDYPYDPRYEDYDRGYDDRHGDQYGYEGYSYGGYRYEGRDYDPRRYDRMQPYFRGRGAGMLDPWLAYTREGQAALSTYVNLRDGYIDEQTADRVNVWFRRYADTNRDMRLTDGEIRVALIQASRNRYNRW